MESDKGIKLTQSQFTFLIVGFLLGPGFIQLPRLIAQVSKQDAWISAIIALVYPMYIILMSLYIIKKYPNDNILSVNRKCYGKVLGTILNVLFLLQFVVIQVTMISDVTRISLIYIIAFLTPIKVSIVTTALALYGGLKGIKVLGKINEYISYLAFTILALSLYALGKGEFINIMPVFGSGIKDILKGAIVTSYYYLGYEAIVVFHTYVGDYKKIKGACFTAIGITTAVWILSIFICIYNLGIDLVIKADWPFMFIFESINVPIINNFLYVFMTAWSLVALKSMANFYFAIAYMLNDITKIKIKTLMLCLYPIFLYIGMILLNSMIKGKVLSVISPAYIVFNMLFYGITGVVAKFKQKTNNAS